MADNYSRLKRRKERKSRQWTNVSAGTSNPSVSEPCVSRIGDGQQKERKEGRKGEAAQNKKSVHVV